jgi:hypothetical protein
MRRHVRDVRADRHVRPDRDRFSPGGTNLPGDSLSLLGARLEVYGDGSAPFGQRQSDRAADAPRCACDDGDSSFKISQILPPPQRNNRPKTCVQQQFV